MPTEHSAASQAAWRVYQVVKWYVGKGNMIVWGSSLKYILWSKNRYLTFELISPIHAAREYEHVYWRGEAFCSEVALCGQEKPVRQRVRAPWQLHIGSPTQWCYLFCDKKWSSMYLLNLTHLFSLKEWMSPQSAPKESQESEWFREVAAELFWIFQCDILHVFQGCDCISPSAEANRVL